ncbi:replication factor C subunit 3/5 [Nematocida sp. LUAm3]|nr:replication factor C subunit 3/5 [Nematocida sp. LUAm3]KAI5173592.1 replication factor C subunit 3/5 [Nematocida sp. LUAm2]KAI5176813.1 replication factor C subunit 3/5 [Nematocida sp. LUAm1]
MLYSKYFARELEEMDELIWRKMFLSFDAQTYPNMILHGAEGTGKRMLLNSIMKHLFKRDPMYMAYTMEIDIGGTKKEVDIIECEDAIEVRVAESGKGDKKVVQRIAQDLSQSKRISEVISEEKERKTRLMIIPDGEHLSHGAQMALRRIMEKGAARFRIIVLSISLSPFIDAFKSRFLLCRIPSLTDEKIFSFLKKAVTEEKKGFSDESIMEIVKKSSGNIQKAFSLLEASIHLGTSITLMQWEDEISDISKRIITSPSVREISAVREQIYKLLDRNIPGHIILSLLVENLLKREKSVETAEKLLQFASLFNMRLKSGNRDLFHIEAFVAQAMSIYGSSSV